METTGCERCRRASGLVDQPDHAPRLADRCRAQRPFRDSGCPWQDTRISSRKMDVCGRLAGLYRRDRKSTRLNSSHLVISYAVFCLKKKKKKILGMILTEDQR